MVQPESILYIMGRGHSGSTVLDALLSSAPDAVGIGEFASALDRPHSMCSCGRTLANCSFWTAVRDVVDARGRWSWEQARAVTRAQGHLKSFPRTLLAKSSSPWIRRNLEVLQEALGAVLKISGKRRVVDSSKELTRALFLARFVDRARIVHLVRDPRAAVASDVYRFERGGRSFLFLRRRVRALRWTPLFVVFVSLRWLGGCLLAELVQRLYPERVTRLRFEDLLARPEAELEHLAAFAGSDLDPVVRAVRTAEPLEAGHRLGGNPGLHGAQLVRFDRNLRGRSLLPGYAALVTAVCWPFLLAYGYPLRRGADEGSAS